MNVHLKRAIFLLFALLSCSCFIQAKADETKDNKSEKKAQSKVESHDSAAVSVPIFYLTDREEDKGSYGSRRKYVIDCKHDPFYGIAKVVVPNTEHKDDAKVFSQLGWEKSTKNAINDVKCDKIDPADHDKARDEFFKRLQAAMDANGSDRVCLFVHGACEGFDDAAEDAATLAYELEYPLILYSWPSVPKTFDYVVDGGNNEWSQAHFNEFIKQLIEYRKEHKLHLILVSHSMGNRLVIRSAHLLAGTGLVKDAELVSPDIDAETFKHYVYGIENQGAILRLYTSTRDKMLALSQMVYGGYYRLGEGVGTVFGSTDKNAKGQKKNAGPAEASPATNVDAAASSAASANKDAVADAKSDDAVPVPSGNHLPEHKKGLAERIDFTTIDTGMRGHSIPFEMLASMIHDDVPGKGLKLVPSTPGKGSELARFMSWSHHLGKIDDQGDPDLCKKIVKTSANKLVTGSK